MLKTFMKLVRPFMIMVVIVAVFLLALHLVNGLTRNKEPQPAPPLVGTTPEGTLYALADNYGKQGTVLVFFDPFNQDTVEHLTEIAAQNQGRVDVMGVVVSQEALTDQQAKVGELALTGVRVLYDPDGTIAKTYGISGVPVTYFIDKNTQIVDAHLSGISSKTLEKAITAIA